MKLTPAPRQRVQHGCGWPPGRSVHSSAVRRASGWRPRGCWA